MSGEAIERAMAELNAEIGACEGLRDIKVELSQENARALRTALASREQQEPVAWAVYYGSDLGPLVYPTEAEARESARRMNQARTEIRVVPLVIGAEPAQP